MFVDGQKLRSRIRECGLSMADVAGSLGINRSTLYRRLWNSGAGLLVKDVAVLSGLLNLTGEERNSIFLLTKLHIMRIRNKALRC